MSGDVDREMKMERARAFSPLDAAYFIADFNRRCASTKQEPINLAEIVKASDPVEIEALHLKVRALHDDEAYFGEKYWTGSRTNDEIYKEMHERHPGFGQESYELALSRGIVAMR